MQERFHLPGGLAPELRFPRLFEHTGPLSRLRRIRHGLRRPKSSPERRYAEAELLHLISWACAFCVPVLALVFAHLLFRPQARPVPRHAVTLAPARRDEARIPVTRPPEPDPEPAAGDPVRSLRTLTSARISNPVLGPDPGLSATRPDRPERLPSHHGLIKRPFDGLLPWSREGLGRRRDAIRRVESHFSQTAVLRALRWLQARQQPDGSWPGPAPAMTGLALLCFLGHAETPGESEEFGNTVRRGIEWLLANQQPDGRFAGRDEHDYSLPIAAYALCEASALTRIPKIGKAAERSVELIVRGQNSGGGWNYNCARSDRNDTSYTGWCVQALRAAELAGLRNEGLAEAMQRAVEGLRKNAHPEGGFGYTSPGQTGLTGVGVLCLQLLGRPNSPEARRGLAWLEQVTCEWNDPWGARPLYYWYYATQAKFHGGGSAWARWDPEFAEELVRNQTVVPQDPDTDRALGYWDTPGPAENYGLIYSTTLCTLTLEVYYRYLATYARVEPASQPDVPDGVGSAFVEIVLPRS